MSQIENREEAANGPIPATTADHHQDDSHQEKMLSDAPQVSYYSDRGAHAPIYIPTDSGMHINHGQFADAPQVFKEVSPLYSVESGSPTSIPSPSEPNLESTETPKPVARICGLRRSAFWVLIVLVIVIIAAAVAGGVGGGLAGRNRNNSAGTTPTLTTPRSMGLQMRSVWFTADFCDSPTALARPAGVANSNRRMPFSMQIWENPDYEGRSQLFYTPGYYETAFLIKSYHWHPGQYTPDMEKCSVSLCNNDLELGWRGASYRENPGTFENSTRADSVIIKCATNFSSPGCPGPLNPPEFSTAPVIAVSPRVTRTRSPLTSSATPSVESVTSRSW